MKKMSSVKNAAALNKQCMEFKNTDENYAQNKAWPRRNNHTFQRYVFFGFTLHIKFIDNAVD